VFASSVLGALVFSLIKIRKVYMLMVVTVLILYLQKDHWQAKSYLQKPDSFYTSIYKSTTDTGESAPIWSTRFMEKVPKSSIEVIGGKAKIVEIKRNSTFHHYKITADIDAQIRENTIYFPGWNIYVDGIPAKIEYQDPNNRGVMTFRVSKGIHDVYVKFEDTKLRLFSNLLSATSLLILIVISILKIWQSSQSSSRRITKKKI
jgi:hypothetical protein